VRALGIDPVHDTRETFRALLDAMSRPGTVERVPAGPADRAVVAALVDHEVSFHTADEKLAEALAAEGRYQPAPPAEAAVVHARDRPDWDVRELRRGSLREPSGGATVVYRVASLAAESESESAADGDGTAVRLTGPGVPGERVAAVGLAPGELTALAKAQSTYPRGVDAVFAADERLLAVPRSASVEVV
jgi:alpha-D-ribose 1-methylphosphonate 5-triphosphate synthase subunit PhnH